MILKKSLIREIFKLFLISQLFVVPFLLMQSYYFNAKPRQIYTFSQYQNALVNYIPTTNTHKGELFIDAGSFVNGAGATMTTFKNYLNVNSIMNVSTPVRLADGQIVMKNLRYVEINAYVFSEKFNKNIKLISSIVVDCNDPYTYMPVTDILAFPKTSKSFVQHVSPTSIEARVISFTCSVPDKDLITVPDNNAESVIDYINNYNLNVLYNLQHGKLHV